MLKTRTQRKSITFSSAQLLHYVASRRRQPFSNGKSRLWGNTSSWAKCFLNDTTLNRKHFFSSSSSFLLSFTVVAFECDWFSCSRLVIFFCITIQQQRQCDTWNLNKKKCHDTNDWNLPLHRLHANERKKRGDDDVRQHNSTLHRVVVIFGICWADGVSWHLSGTQVLYHCVSRDLHNIYLVQLCQVLDVSFSLSLSHFFLGMQKHKTLLSHSIGTLSLGKMTVAVITDKVESQMEIQQAETSHYWNRKVIYANGISFRSGIGSMERRSHIKMSAAQSDGNKMFQAHAKQLNFFVSLETAWKSHTKNRLWQQIIKLWEENEHNSTLSATFYRFN